MIKKQKRIIKKHTRRGAKIIVKMLEATGIPEGYATTVAWFAERMMLASFALAVLSFAAGSMFVLKLSQPIGDSEIYGGAVHRAQLAEDGIKVFSQQVIDVTSPVFASLINDNHDPEPPKVDEVAIRKAKLKEYLAAKNSPFAKDDAALTAFATSKNMKLMVAISFVESTFGQHCYYYNCSGIGGTPPTLRKYDSYAEWIQDFDNVLEARYKGVPPEKFIGLYVQPGSPNWIYGVKQTLKELDAKGIA